MKKFAVRGSIALVVLFFIALVADSLVAARAEHRISQNIYQHSNLATPPRVQVAGFPYTAAIFTHELQAVTVNATDGDSLGHGAPGCPQGDTGVTFGGSRRPDRMVSSLYMRS